MNTNINRLQKLLAATAFSTVLAGGVVPAFSASADVAAQPAAASSESAKSSEAAPAAAAARSSDNRNPSSYALHSALLRAPASPAALPRQ